MYHFENQNRIPLKFVLFSEFSHFYTIVQRSDWQETRFFWPIDNSQQLDFLAELLFSGVNFIDSFL